MTDAKMGPGEPGEDDGHQDGSRRRWWVPRCSGQKQAEMTGSQMVQENQDDVVDAKMGPAGPEGADGHQNRSRRSRGR